MRYVILGEMNSLSLFNFKNAFVYWRISLVGEMFSPEILISF